MSIDKILWGVRAGKTGDAESLFFEQNVIALGWHELGDLSKLDANREAFKLHYAAMRPLAKAGSIPGSAGQLYRFVHEMQEGDFVLFPSKRTRTVHIGRITGDYKFSPRKAKHYPNQRSVTWIKEIPRAHFSQGALYEIGSALTLFTVKTYAEEFFNALSDKNSSLPMPAVHDETVVEVTNNVTESTSDYVLKVLAQETKGHPFADFVGHLLEKMGYRTRISPPGVDGGVDIVAHKDELGFEPPIIKVQVKSSVGSVGDPIISQLYGKVGPTEFGLFVTLGTFTTQAIQFGKSKTNLRLIDGQALVELILEHYEELDSKYKGLLPLKRVYVPQLSALETD